jgi:hypothetical protein
VEFQSRGTGPEGTAENNPGCDPRCDPGCDPVCTRGDSGFTIGVPVEMTPTKPLRHSRCHPPILFSAFGEARQAMNSELSSVSIQGSGLTDWRRDLSILAELGRRSGSIRKNSASPPPASGV